MTGGAFLSAMTDKRRKPNFVVLVQVPRTQNDTNKLR